MKQGNFSSFDAAAISYDTDFTYSEIGKIQRKLVHKFLEEKILQANNLSILEINCGTGIDANWLAKKGNSVIASDASTKMIEVANQHLSTKEIKDLQFIQASFSDLKEKLSGKKFDLIFSNFAGLNCISESELRSLISDCSDLLQPKGNLVLVMLGRKCIWERIYFLIKGNRKAAFRRMEKGPIPAHLGEGIMQNTYYFSPKEIQNFAANQFTLKHKQTIGITIPPSYLNPFFKTKKWMLKLLHAIEKLIGKLSFLADYGDHYLVVFEKKIKA